MLLNKSFFVFFLFLQISCMEDLNSSFSLLFKKKILFFFYFFWRKSGLLSFFPKTEGFRNSNTSIFIFQKCRYQQMWDIDLFLSQKLAISLKKNVNVPWNSPFSMRIFINLRNFCRNQPKNWQKINVNTNIKNRFFRFFCFNTFDFVLILVDCKLWFLFKIEILDSPKA